ncbi:hypothetical protein pb186bvf_019655 [Paramecium bursaria]
MQFIISMMDLTQVLFFATLMNKFNKYRSQIDTIFNNLERLKYIILKTKKSFKFRLDAQVKYEYLLIQQLFSISRNTKLWYYIYLQIYFPNRNNNKKNMNCKTLAFALVVVAALSQTCTTGQFLYNGVCIFNNCTDVYTKRFGTTYSTTGVGTIPINFNTQVGIDAQGQTQITIAFVDVQNDSATQVDNPGSCIVPVHNRYSLNFANKTGSFTPSITSTYVQQTGYRQWVYTIPSTTYQTALLSTLSNSTHLVYVGYYGVDFNVVNITQVTLQYTFQIAVLRSTNASAVTNFNQLLTSQTSTCNTANQCITSASSAVFFCTTSSCATPTTTIQLALNQNYWLYVNITSTGFTTYKLTNPTVTLTSGSTLARVYTPPAANVTVNPGNTIIAQTVDFAYTNVQITVATTLAPPNRRILQSATGSNSVSMGMTAASNTITCVQNSSGQCATCTEQCAANKGSASTNCPPCSGSYLFVLVALLGLLL